MTPEHPPVIAWFSYFPVEWLPDAPETVLRLPRQHPASWQRVLLQELENVPGLRLHILVLRKEFERNLTFKRRGVTFHLIKTPGGWRAPSLFWFDTWLIRRKLAEIQPDVVHAWGTENGAASVASRLKYPSVVTLQGLLAWYGEHVPLNPYNRLAAWLEKRCLPRAPVVTMESSFVLQFVRQRWPRLNVRQIEHAPDWIFHRLERRPQISPFRFIHVANVSHRKGTDLLLSALDQMRDEINFELLIVDNPDPTFLGHLRTVTSAALWQRIRFKQDLRPADVATEMAAATMMIFPTRVDSSPNSVKEAVVAGVPVIGSQVGGIPDYVIPDRNGLLFPPGDVTELLQAIRAACRHPLFSQGRVDPATLSKMRDYLSPALMGNRFLELYNEVLQTSR
ncbi:MAG: glycosyltransferase family 4 protein [Verrucomicrobia bacterium]|nr:glycosyltransferase family 4 protein [Verrucomicrobiota bacterium]MDE3097832.1 glycosyltransferase family 4 protein [Verrucomicrobiota bacterium]